eukprot:5462206-Amphidinium_carterae.3
MSTIIVESFVLAISRVLGIESSMRCTSDTRHQLSTSRRRGCSRDIGHGEVHKPSPMPKGKTHQRPRTRCINK